MGQVCVKTNSQTTEGSRRNKKKEDKKIRASSIVKADIDDDIHVSEEQDQDLPVSEEQKEEKVIEEKEIKGGSSGLDNMLKTAEFRDESITLEDIDQLISEQASASLEEREKFHQRILNFRKFKGFKKVKNYQENYKLQKKLGEGAFGSVWSAVHKKAKAACAIKVVKKHKLTEMEVYHELMMNELKVLEDVNHPQIPKTFELFEDEKNYYIVTELITGGNMLEKMLKLQTMNEVDTAKVVKQTLLALNYMHIDKNMVHRDIKLENLLVQPDNSGPNGEIKIKLTDFGFATYVKVGEKMDLPLGSPLYMAPQIVARQDYSRKCDTWAVGVMTYIMLSGAPPFYDKNTNRLNKYICKKPVAFPDKYFKDISQDARDFIIQCLKKNESSRPEIGEMLEHPWIKTISERDVNEKVKIDICANLNNFKKADVFQSGVMSIITNLMTTATELDELDRMFMKFDSNNDGTLSPEEIREGMTEVLGLFEAEQMDWDHFFNQVDGNKDGKIDHTEFITAALNRAKMLSQNNVNNIFDMFDANGDGYIDLDELKAVFQNKLDLGDSEVVDIYNESQVFETDHSEISESPKMSKGEEESIWKMIMDTADQDKDGLISKKEFQDSMEKILRMRSSIFKNRSGMSSNE